jgi:hypothetical protein
MSSGRVRAGAWIGEGAAFGAVGACATLVIYGAMRSRPEWLAWPEYVIVRVLESGLGLLLEPYVLLVERRGYVLLPFIAALLIWRRTRRILVAALGAVVMIESARLAALACFSTYVMQPTAGLLTVPVAAVPAAYIAWRRRWPVLAVAVFAFGLCAGVALALPLQHDYPAIVSPLHRFVPSALASLACAWVIARWLIDPAERGLRRFRRLWGLCSIAVSCLFMIAITTSWFRPRPAPPTRLLGGSAYDVYVTGTPPVLVWTDTEHVHVVTDPYGAARDGYELSAADGRTPQRIWASPSDGFYVQMQGSIGWWKAPPRGQRIASAPAVTFQDDILQDGSPWAFAEDPSTRRVFMMSQWQSHYAVMDRDTGALTTTGRFSTALQGAWHATPDLPARRVYISSALADGNLYELDLDSLAIVRRAGAVDVHEMVLDPERHLVWGARPLTGQVVGLDDTSLRVRYRIHAGFATRDLQRDPRSDVLYTCSMPGDVFRIDSERHVAERLTWCGRLCRNLYLDVERETLWAATDDGICRIPLAPADARATMNR